MVGGTRWLRCDRLLAIQLLLWECTWGLIFPGVNVALIRRSDTGVNNNIGQSMSMSMLGCMKVDVVGSNVNRVIWKGSRVCGSERNVVCNGSRIGSCWSLMS